MSRLSQAQKIAEWLINHPGERFTARQLAEVIVSRYSEDYADKRANLRFADNKAFIGQIVAEIGAQKNAIARCHTSLRWQDKPRPRVYWFDPDPALPPTSITEPEDDESDGEVQVIQGSSSLSEHDLYPLLMQYLKFEHQLYCMRVDEKRSRSNARKHFFQAVSNSSWANEGYLVCTGIVGKDTEDELRMLSALHGIGVIALSLENPSESEIVVPARARQEIDWQSINRLVEENEDMRDFVELVSTYYQTGRLRSKDWNKV
ncbi:MAG: hypothetical protein ACU4EQ_11865 [Candidatus Nitrosoglobus sp.]